MSCVCVCSQASRSRATLSCDSSYFSYWQGTIQASYAVMLLLLPVYVRWKFGVPFVQRCFRDDHVSVVLKYECLHVKLLKPC